MFKKFFGKRAEKTDDYFQLADKLFKSGRLPEALKHINKVLEINPSDFASVE